MTSMVPEVLVMVAEAKEGTKLATVLGRSKTEDWNNLAELRLDTFGGKCVPKVIN